MAFVDINNSEESFIKNNSMKEEINNDLFNNYSNPKRQFNNEILNYLKNIDNKIIKLNKKIELQHMNTKENLNRIAEIITEGHLNPKIQE